MYAGIWGGEVRLSGWAHNDVVRATGVAARQIAAFNYA